MQRRYLKLEAAYKDWGEGTYRKGFGVHGLHLGYCLVIQLQLCDTPISRCIALLLFPSPGLASVLEQVSHLNFRHLYSSGLLSLTIACVSFPWTVWFIWFVWPYVKKVGCFTHTCIGPGVPLLGHTALMISSVGACVYYMIIFE